MTHRIALAALVAASIGLSGCGGISRVIGVNENATPAVQETEAAAKAAFLEAVTRRLDHCTITGTANLEVGVSARSGFANTFGLNCPAQPWAAEAVIVPLAKAAE